MPHVSTSPLQSFISRTESHIIIASFTTESDLSIYGLGQKNYTLKIEKIWYIGQDRNAHTYKTWTREHNPKNKTR